MAQKSKTDTFKPGDPFPIDTIRVSERAKQQLITLKRNTGIEHWNVLCRWALCVSLQEPSKPPIEGESALSSLEMHWKTFAGHEEDAYKAVLLARVIKDFGTVSPSLISTQFRLHLHRGISRLAGKKIRSIEDLVRVAVDA
ncbi:DNA sulfur modification protein DndE [Acidobacterium sp.]|uniref:DNA sulfur modification protein DndE n=1 Tax=Acidobacterium capsulatum (strain ATCC 51196 / DSM 11244 / BCRC 80197 / JCM 7670 / NBRC 15755 / NCIMB 13165 / 161) TaxID=240015 RepID=C1F5K3_ACIC5|nr:DNA sulfur modification protein DndE [Acidobacterium capsulatum ATCC 51196]HCT61207.1 DNA sulfur modification protein DndE [Acidobacterium sp.]